MTLKSWLRRAVVAVVIAAVGYTVIDLVAHVDWASVWDALERTTWGQIALLFLLLVVKQTLNAAPLSFFIRGLSMFRATVNDQASTLVMMVAPPPSDLVLRLRIFASWGIDRTPALAGTIMNVLTYYTNRLLVPTFGVVLLLAVGGVDLTQLAVAAVALAAGLGLILLMRLGVRDPAAAERIGLRSGRLAQRIRSSIDPAALAAKTLEFRGLVAAHFPSAFPRALLVLFAMTLVDALILLLALRFVGVAGSALPALVVIGGFLVWFPLTILPLSGLGVLDAALLAMYTATAGETFESEIIAALVIYRLVSIGGTALLGLLALTSWRATTGAASGAGRGISRT